MHWYSTAKEEKAKRTSGRGGESVVTKQHLSGLEAQIARQTLAASIGVHITTCVPTELIHAWSAACVCRAVDDIWHEFSNAEKDSLIRAVNKALRENGGGAVYNLTKLNKYLQNARYKLSTQSGGERMLFYACVSSIVMLCTDTFVVVHLLLPPLWGLHRR